MGLGNDYYRERGFLETWKNNSWSIAYTFVGTMKAISCPTSNWCMTVTKNEDDAWRLKWLEKSGGVFERRHLLAAATGRGERPEDQRRLLHL